MTLITDEKFLLETIRFERVDQSFHDFYIALKKAYYSGGKKF